MVDIESFFQHKRPVAEKLMAYGFTASPDGYRLALPIQNGQLIAKIRVLADGKADFQVFDAQSGDEYVLARVAGAAGSYVGEVRQALEAAFADIARMCFEPEYFKEAQSKRISQEIELRHHAKPEFLWPDAFPSFAALRVPGQKAWFAVVGCVERAKFGLTGGGSVEVINLKDEPRAVAEKIEHRLAYPAYHMNKKNWYSVFMDGSLPDEEILEMAARSLNSVRKPKNTSF